MKKDDLVVVLGFLLVLLGVLLATTSWWRGGIAATAIGLSLGGVMPILELLRGGLSEIFGSTKGDADVE